MIGATTQDEYRNTIMKNAALARRFNEVTVNAPSPEDTLAILKGVRSLYEKHHHVKFPDDALKAAVDYSVQYIPQRSLPDKAIDLVDMTAAHLSAQHPVTDKVSLENDLKNAKTEQDQAAAKEDFEKAAAAKKRVEELEDKLKNVSSENKKEEVVVKPNDIAQSVERLTGIPVAKMGANDIERLKGIDRRSFKGQGNWPKRGR